MSSADLSWVSLERDGDIATLTLETPPANHWHEPALVAFYERVSVLAREDSPRCLIITGRAPSEGSSDDAWFSSGLEPGALQSEDSLVGANLARLFTQAFGALRRYPGVTLAALNGHGHNEGLALALSCDFRIASDVARFRFNAGSQGRLAFGGSTQLLPRLVGESWAKRMLLMETTLDAGQAQAIGLVDEVVAPSEVLAVTRDWAGQCLNQTPMASRAAKQLVEHARMRPLETGFAAEREWQANLYEAGEHRTSGQQATGNPNAGRE